MASSIAFDSLMAHKARLGRPLCMGHRGASGSAPENTMAAFQRAKALGADAVECDVHLSADGHLIVIHDATLDRTTNGQGPVAALPMHQLKALDAGSWYGPAFAGEPLPTLEELLEWSATGLPVVIEVKWHPEAPRVVEACLRLVDRMHASERVAFIAFDHRVALGIKEARPSWSCGVLYVGHPVDPVQMAQAARADGLLPQFGFATPELVAQAHAARQWVGVWSPNEPQELRHALATGVDLIGTNFPERLLALAAEGPVVR